MMIIRDFKDNDNNVQLVVKQYWDKTLRVEAWCEEGPYSIITENLCNKKLKEDMAYIKVDELNPFIIYDLINVGYLVPRREFDPDLDEFPDDEDRFIYDYGFSGCCCYPLVKFNINKIKEEN